ncbi:YceD family protein [Carnobacterium funditum]|uniref:YceD family protein n=1 Tax=Carnobacterium funditum TaxID=2752 RepID=UPI000558C4F8|nr:YceD family protein [Carnobacterium funditum]
MKWSLNELQKYRFEPLIFSETVDLKKSLIKRNKEILDVSPILLEGNLIVQENEILLHMVVSLNVTLPSARSLEPVLIPLSLEVDEIYIPEHITSREIDEEEGTIIQLENDWIDLSEAIEDAVLLNIPIQVFTEEEAQENKMPSGNDWVVMSERDFISEKTEQKAETLDPRFAGLKDLFKNESDDKK